MKKQIFTIALFMFGTYLNADMVNLIERNSKSELVIKEVNDDKIGFNEDLETFKNFTILKGKSSEAKKLSELGDEEKVRVLTLAYHLNRARGYFLDTLQATHLEKLKNIKVRYDISNGFSPSKHFTKAEDEFNNAVTNRAANKFISSDEGIKPWDIEIWFRPAREEKVRSLRGTFTQNSDVTEDFMNLADSAVYDVTRQLSLGIDTPMLRMNHYASQLGLILMMKKVIPNALDISMSSIPFKVKLDSAMVPEIIYHEFTHVALSDAIPLTGSYAVSEAMANYFAAIISGGSNIAHKLGEYGKNIDAITIQKHLKYRSEFESNSELAHHPFTFNFLWSIRKRVQEEIQYEEISGDILFDKIVFDSRNYLDLSDENTITKVLPNALLKATTKLVNDKNISRSIRLIISQEAKKFGM